MVPKKLYKFSSFGSKILGVLADDKLYFSDPKTFNDPLDCSPGIHMDVEKKSLEKLFLKLLADRLGREKALKALNSQRYLSTEPQTVEEQERWYVAGLGNAIFNEIIGEMSKFGVLSLARRWDSVLMWSHYADQHKGICIEYSTVDHMCKEMGMDIQPVSYAKSGVIKMTDILNWKLHNSDHSRQKIKDTFFFAKASPWRYEKEWRVVTPSSGLRSSPFIIKAIYFGCRCEPAVVTSIVKLLCPDSRGIAFYEVYTTSDVFKLRRRLVNTDRELACGVSDSPLRHFRELIRESEPSDDLRFTGES